ncbi:MAG TPA: SpoIID/LytB domain-containing protein [Pyrinomonadaceae bacterium]|nr:SpoIID/LytB domain-containing protein [Pyrinomonadaceae bacterium]
MKPSVRSKGIALLLIHSLIFSTFALAQDDVQQTRPRRVGVPTPQPEATQTDEIFRVESSLAELAGEPTIRVGLATDARSVTISSAGTLLQTADSNAAPTPLGVARVRIEPRKYPTPTLPDERDATLADTKSARDADANAAARNDASTRRQTERANSPANSNTERGRNPNARRETGAGSIRLASRASAGARGAVVYASGTTPLLEVRAPLTFAAGDELQTPLKFNEKAYRGRLEVFANTRGTLTVVNVVGLEDYVRGVVPNELSPGGFPAVEALKAQAIAARTYAVSHRGQFAADGYDLLPTTRSQVYGGRQTEHPLTDRAVAETRGRVATYRGEIIDALYTSTCGGRTEHAENIFGGAQVPYLRGRECGWEGAQALTPHVVRTSREPPAFREGEHLSSARDLALLRTHGFRLGVAPRVTDEWLAAPLAVDEARALLDGIAALSRRPIPLVSNEVVRPPAFSSALAEAADGESRGNVLLNSADIEYILAFRDADEIPARHRADVALLMREGHLSLYADATLRPRQPLTRARALGTVAHLVEARGLFRLQKASARPSASGALVVRTLEGKGADRTLNLSEDAYLFRAFGDNLHQMREVALVGGEPVVFHTDARGAVDYLEVRPAPNGAASDRFSQYTNWTVALTPAEVAGRLARWTEGIGSIVNLRVAARGSSRRALDLEVTGTNGVAHVRGGRIRSALGLREQLFVIQRREDETGKLTGFVLTGRGWGHGVGMCQVGAYGLARAGWTYDKILQAYYTGITLTKLY